MKAPLNGYDRSHTPQALQITLIPALEAVAVVLRRALPALIDEVLAVVRDSRSRGSHALVLTDACVGMCYLRNLQAQSPQPKHEAFGACELGYLHVHVTDPPQMAAGPKGGLPPMPLEI